jgi:hypothetical protein
MCEHIELITKGAYHESGHVVIGYLMGYSVNAMRLDPTDPGAGVSRFNYGDDLILITSLFNPMEFSDIYNGLAIERRGRTPEIGDKIHKILVAGSCAEAFYIHEILHQGEGEGEISGPDLEKIVQIQHSFNLLGLPFPEERHQQTYTNVYGALFNQEIRTAIESLVQRIIHTDGYSLNQNEIEQVLTDCGYFDFITQQRN